MATFDEHINQSKRNFSFLENINTHCKDFYDWQVTVCFYSALHLVNAHLSTFNLQYRKHKDVKAVLNPFAAASPARLPNDEYSAYVSLQSLSRRARYLVSEKDDNLENPNAFFTYDKHFKKALIHLDKIAAYFQNKYKFTLREYKVECIGLNYGELKFIKK